MPPHQDITDVFGVRAQITIKFVTKLLQARGRESREVIEYVLRCCSQQWMSLTRFWKTYLRWLHRSLCILYITSNSSICFIWAIKLVADNLPCSFNPLQLPVRVLEIGELMTRMKDCWRSAKRSRYPWCRLTHGNTINLQVICHIIVVVQCSFRNAQGRPDSRLISRI